MLGHFELMIKRIFLKISCGGTLGHMHGAHWDKFPRASYIHIDDVSEVKTFFVRTWLETKNILLE